MSPSAASFRLFVYGTLRPGRRNHAAYCTGFRSIVDAAVVGSTTPHPAGYPVLDVPAAHVLARGTADPVADTRALSRIEPVVPPAPGWGRVPGELLTFDDPAERLPRLDELEDFRPGAPSLYFRIVIPVRPVGGTPVAAWTYVRGDAMSGD